MSVRELSSETIHASCVAIMGRGLLIEGPSGAGKSDLALRLIDRGATLVSDDYTLLRRMAGRLIASAPASISGKLEERGIGIVEMPSLAEAPVMLMLALVSPVERLPETILPTRTLAGMTLPMLGFDPFGASAPLRAELALARFGATR